MPLLNETALPRPNEEGMPLSARAVVTPIVEGTPGDLIRRRIEVILAAAPPAERRRRARSPA